jgi:hypothetical protein
MTQASIPKVAGWRIWRLKLEIFCVKTSGYYKLNLNASSSNNMWRMVAPKHSQGF